MPFIKEYINDETVMEDVKKLQRNGVNSKDIYILTHDDDRTSRIANNVNANTIGLSEQDVKTVVSNIFSKKGDELRAKLQEIGLSEEDAHEYEEDMDEGKVLLIVTSDKNIESLLV
ncbi:general stress protein [Halobacillus sp. A5]|uniref:general stress protein n=1 Tax=Halobacillus sp. A5 TaxID=2880263 RepID=UPI0020A6480C|nr:general stress protein [Halobacillus sp. A5]MCP3027979.1 general stress protein [Halobacillus sp. A5]